MFFPKNLTLYWAPKDFKSSSIIGGFFFTGVNKFGFHEFQYKGALNYQHNYSTQTLSSNSWYVAGISQVNKARFKRRTFNTCAEPNTYLGRPKLLSSIVDSDGRTLHVPSLIIRGEKKYHPYCLK